MKKTQYIVLEAHSPDSAKLFSDYDFHVTFMLGSNALSAWTEHGKHFAALPWESGSIWKASIPWAVHAR